ncbi:hypothetical protein LEP1GSC043_1185 [Leptospira weilii str. Ecochallenge]|uniref:Lipoprotein n=1 Tax=Leptospira weilii str. Ecochallenge TaxID=1049986 RepID=N1U199_9LEPT|nr:hypothetical protein LEP1GSC043_1185 [Leptospira weilii str. Ecochallenge]
MTLFKKILVQLLIAAMALTGFSGLIAEEPTTETPSEQTESQKETKSEKKERNLRNTKRLKRPESQKSLKKKKQKVKKKKRHLLPNLPHLLVKSNNSFSVYLFKDRRIFLFAPHPSNPF